MRATASNSRILYGQSEVGGFISGTGDATDILAYRAFVTEQHGNDVSGFNCRISKTGTTA
jgi:hypothetical protein